MKYRAQFAIQTIILTSFIQYNGCFDINQESSGFKFVPQTPNFGHVETEKKNLEDGRGFPSASINLAEESDLIMDDYKSTENQDKKVDQKIPNKKNLSESLDNHKIKFTGTNSVGLTADGKDQNDMINNMNSLRHPKNLIEEAKQMNTHRNYNEKELASVESQPKINLAQGTFYLTKTIQKDLLQIRS